MKSFVKYTFATVVGIFITLIIFSVISIVSIAGMIATQGVTAPIKDGSILKIDMAGELTERADENPFAALMGDMAATQSLEDALLALKKAAKSDKIKGVFLCGSSLATQHHRGEARQSRYRNPRPPPKRCSHAHRDPSSAAKPLHKVPDHKL